MTDQLKITTTYIPHLRSAFSRANVVLFTGAGFSRDGVNHSGNNVPQVGELVESLWNICYPGDQFDPSTQLQDVYEAAIQANRNATAQLMRESFTVHAQKCPDYYGRLLAMPWNQVYTLNVDDLQEKLLDLHQPGRTIRSVSATTDRITSVDPAALNVIHINGALCDVPDKVTFSRTQYAVRRIGDPFYDVLRKDLVSRPVVFIGTSLEEGPMWQHLVMRGSKPAREREIRPRSYLVTPSLNRSKQALLSNFNIVWLPFTTEQFCDEFLGEMQDERTEGFKFIAEQLKQQESGGFQLLQISDIPEGSAEPTDYLLGAEPVWDDATHNRIAYRDCFDEIIGDINKLRAKSEIDDFIVVTGTAGTGKTSAMMQIALRMEADGMPTAWIDAKDCFNAYRAKDAVIADKGLELLLINDADVWGRYTSRIVKELLEINPRLIIVCECRSTKVERIIDRIELGKTICHEFTIPYLGDNDITALLGVLDRENRLGQLKGKSQHERRALFEAESGRQMLVAMYKATHGVEFRERATNELNELDNVQKFLYGLTCVAHAHRFMIKRDEVAIAFGDDISEWPRALDALIRRKIIIQGKGDSYKARHREIAQFVYNELGVQGSMEGVISALVRISGTRTTTTMKNHERPRKMLSTFLNHNLLLRVVGQDAARHIYSDYEPLLEWSSHYWLHRGALELETENLGQAENFLHQAKSLSPNDVFVDNELAYLNLRKANNAPTDISSQDLVDSALETFEAVVLRRPDQLAHTAHMAGKQGLRWAQSSTMTPMKKQEFLGELLKNVERAMPDDVENMLFDLAKELKKAILLMAVPQDEAET